MCVHDREVLKARWCEPTLSVVDVRIGDEDGSGDSAYRFGPTRFSVIPRSAVGNVSIRFVPDQNADVLIAALRCAACSFKTDALAVSMLPCYGTDVTTAHAPTDPPGWSCPALPSNPSPVSSLC